MTLTKMIPQFVALMLGLIVSLTAYNLMVRDRKSLEDADYKRSVLKKCIEGCDEYAETDEMYVDCIAKCVEDQCK